MSRWPALAAVLLAAAAVLLPAPASAQPVCTVRIDDSCSYKWSGWPGSNGFNTYVMDQAVNVQPGSAGSLTATSPSQWTTTAHYASCGGCVQTANMVQQQTNDWGRHGWNGTADTPVSALSKLQVKYAETSPRATASYEFATDIWTSYAGQLGGGSGDIMMWADTQGRCNPGAFGGTVLGHATFFGQHWTVHRYGPRGAEIIFVLDGAGGPGSCARQRAGTFHELVALRWLARHVAGFPAYKTLTMQLLNTGWEITGGSGTFKVTSLSYPVTVAP